MPRDWTTFELTCHDCGAVGELAIWTDKINDWGYVWSGFDGQADFDGPKIQTVICLYCFGKNATSKRNN